MSVPTAEKSLTIVFAGKTGTGKSTTLNKLFGLNWNTDHAVACTKKPQIANLTCSQYPELSHAQLRVVDMPGIGESIEADEKYLSFYEEWISQADSLAWVTQADTRAYKRDEIFLTKLIPLCAPSLLFTVALNKIDCLGVDKDEKPFDIDLKEPSQEQLKQITAKIEDVYTVFKGVIKDPLVFEKKQIVPYTAIYEWGLNILKTQVLRK